MQGIKHLYVENAKLIYRLEFKRNITIIKGLSGTGKSRLIGMLEAYKENAKSSGIKVKCNCDWDIITPSRVESIKDISNKLLFIDEYEFLATREFAKSIRNTSNYYVIITREALRDIPYSVDEIYELSSRIGENEQNNKVTINEQRYIMLDSRHRMNLMNIHRMLTEDSNSGYQFFSKVAERLKIKCEEVGGNSNIYKALMNSYNTLAIVDGAAFGPLIEEIINDKDIAERGNLVFAHDSFERILIELCYSWDKEVVDMLNNPSDYIEPSQYFTWERYFYNYIVNISKNRENFRYSKSKLSSGYLSDKVIDKIIERMGLNNA